MVVVNFNGIGGVVFKEVGALVSDDRRSFEYLWDSLGNKSCPGCGSCEFYFMGGKRLRCKSCKKDFWPLKGTRFSLMNMFLFRLAFID